MKKLCKPLSVFLTLVLFFGAFSGTKAFLGPGISAQSADATSSAEAALPKDLFAMESANTTLYHTIVVGIFTVPDDIRELQCRINNTATSTFQIANIGTNVSGNSVRPNDLSIGDYASSQGSVTVNCQTTVQLDEGAIVAVLGYSSTATVQNALNAITCNAGYSSVYLSNGSLETGNAAVSIEKALLGDMNGDNAVDDTDYTMALQAGAGAITLTNVQQMAGDVNFDGIVNSKDALRITRYGVSIFSFLGTASMLPMSDTTTNFDETPIYTLVNANTQQNIYRGANTDFFSVGTPGESDVHNFYISYETSGAYSIYDTVRHAYLGLNSSNQATLVDQTSDSRLWYLVPYGNDKYRLMNYEKPEYLLCKNGNTATVTAGRNYANALWEIKPLTINIIGYVDGGYRARHGSNSTSTVQTDLNGIAAILESQFGIEVSVQVQQATYESFADECLNDNCGSWCSCDQIQGHEFICNETSANTNPFNYDIVHHNNGLARHRAFATAKADGDNIVIQYTGHNVCTSDDEHERNTLWGLATSTQQVATVYNFFGTDNPDNRYDKAYRDRMVGLHEISHCLGALKANYSGVDTAHGACVMSVASQNRDMYIQSWGQPSRYANFFCNGCRQAILQYLQAYY